MQNTSSHHDGSTWAAETAQDDAVAQAREEQFLLAGALAASIARAYRVRMVELTSR